MTEPVTHADCLHNATMIDSSTTKSCEYLHAVGAFFRHRSFRVSFLLHLPADDGFAAASRAHIFIPAGGGFAFGFAMAKVVLLSKKYSADGRVPIHHRVAFVNDSSSAPRALVRTKLGVLGGKK